MAYQIETSDPKPDVDIGHVIETMRALKVGKANSFLIPAADFMDARGTWPTQRLGQRIHHAAVRLGIKVKLKRELDPTPGLRVRRVA